MHSLPQTPWPELIGQVEALETLQLDPLVTRQLESLPSAATIHFYTPTFKSYESSEIAACAKNAWPAISITGGECKLQCDHCKAKVLEPMIPARDPEALWRVANEQIAAGAEGLLLTGGSNHRDEVEYDPFYATIRRIKDEFPELRIAAHTALVNDQQARAMEQSGIDVAMTDVIGAQETITQVYHLKRPMEDFEATLAALEPTSMKVVPHIVIGLHYGQLLGEWRALEMIARHPPDALVLVVVMPYYAPPHRPFVVPDPNEIGRFFYDARRALPETSILLGCARPGGLTKSLIDSYAVMAGFDGIAHPSEGTVELAARSGRRVRVTPACCSIMVGEEITGEERGSYELTLDELISERATASAPRSAGRLDAIPVISAPFSG